MIVLSSGAWDAVVPVMMEGVPRPASTMSRLRKPPVARGQSSSSQPRQDCGRLGPVVPPAFSTGSAQRLKSLASFLTTRSLAGPQARVLEEPTARTAALFAQGLQTRGPLELDLGDRLGAL
jgi:hypothetical protein